MSRRDQIGEDEFAFLLRLKARGVTRAEFEYVGSGRKAQRRLTAVEFAPIGEDDVARLLQASEAKFNDRILEDVDPNTRARIEERLRERTHYHSS